MSAVLADVATADARTWELKPLAEIAEILDGKRIPVNAKEREKRCGRVPYYGATGQVGWIDDFLFDEELVLLGEDGAPFLEQSKPKAYVIRGRSWVNNHAHVLRSRAVPTGWLVHYLNVVRYDGLVTGTTRLKLTQAAMRQIRVPVAPWQVMERRVAELEKQFSRLDEAVANLKRVKDRLIGYKGSVISEAVGGRLTVDDGNVPMGWRRCRLGDAAAKITSGSRDWSPYYGRGDSIFLLAQNVRPMSPDFSVVQHVDPPEADPARTRSRVQRGDLLVTIVGANTGQACMVGDLPGETFVCQSVALVRPVPATSAPYLNLWLNSPEHGRRYFDRCMYGQGRPHLGFEQLASMPIAIPPPHEQARIVTEVDRRLSIVREVEAEVGANLKRAQALRQAVLGRAFALPPVSHPKPDAGTYSL